MINVCVVNEECADGVTSAILFLIGNDWRGLSYYHVLSHKVITFFSSQHTGSGSQHYAEIRGTVFNILRILHLF